MVKAVAICIPFAVGAVFALTALVLTSYALTLKYWVDYNLVTTFAGTVSGFAVTGTVTTTAHFGLWKSCYTAVTATTVTFTSSTTYSTLSDCIDSDSTTYIDGDTIKAIRNLALFADTLIGVNFLLGIACAVLIMLPKVPGKAKQALTLTAMITAYVASIMVMAALIYLDKELVTGMSVGNTVNYAIAADVLVFVAGLTYTSGVVLLFLEIKKAGKVKQGPAESEDSATVKTEMKVTVTPPQEESAKDKNAKA